MQDLLEIKASGKIVDELFRLILRRPVNDKSFMTRYDQSHDLRYWINRLIQSTEFEGKFLQRFGVEKLCGEYIPDEEFHTPRLTPLIPAKKILLTGSCLTEAWVDVLKISYPLLQFRHVLSNRASELEDIPDEYMRGVSYQIAQIPLRTLVDDAMLFGETFDALSLDEYERNFCRSVAMLKLSHERLMKYKRNWNFPVFVLNFAVPQQNSLGCLMPRYELSNFRHYVERLNVELADLVSNEPNVHLIDYDGILSSLGKRHIMDDVTVASNHGSYLGATHWSEDIDLTPHGDVASIYRPKTRQAMMAAFQECVTAYDVLSPTCKIKIVIFDLDGTLWRGVPAEMDDFSASRISEGWPLGILEAAAVLKKRGVLLAIASKNDPETARRIWEQVYGKRFALSNFASVKISWESKVQSVAEILREVNILPDNCLFVDDNPVEREQVANAFPGIKIISGPVSTWKRLLLWSPELQNAVITKESAGRTESIRKVVEREEHKLAESPEAYIASLEVKVDIAVILTASDKRLVRASELLNKTNQFNTTGRRWSNAELDAFFAEGGRLYAATVSDRLNDYGLTALVVQRECVCEQMVMSCRVFGLNVEHELLGKVVAGLSDPRAAKIAFRPTGKNGPSAKFLSSLGIALDDADPLLIATYALAGSSLIC